MPLVNKVAATTAGRAILQKVYDSEKQILGKSDVPKESMDPTTSVVSSQKPNRPRPSRKARKGPRSSRKHRSMFDLQLFRNGESGEYKLSRGFFNKTSDSSSLETITDNSSYENPIRLEGMEELNKDRTKDEEDEQEGVLPVSTPKASNLENSTAGKEDLQSDLSKHMADSTGPPTTVQTKEKGKIDLRKEESALKMMRHHPSETPIFPERSIIDVTSREYYFNGHSQSKNSTEDTAL